MEIVNLARRDKDTEIDRLLLYMIFMTCFVAKTIIRRTDRSRTQLSQAALREKPLFILTLKPFRVVQKWSCIPELAWYAKAFLFLRPCVSRGRQQ